jgi:hypothetical protein
MGWWKSALANLRHWRRLSWPERLLLVEASACVTATVAGVRLLGVRSWQGLAARLTAGGRARAGGVPSEYTRAATRMVGAFAAHGPWRATCLHRSLA